MFKYLAKRAVTYLVMAYLATTAAYFLACSYFRPGNLMLDRTPRPTPEQVQHSLAPWDSIRPSQSATLLGMAQGDCPALGLGTQPGRHLRQC